MTPSALPQGSMSSLLRPLVLFSASILLCPLYWHIESWPSRLLLAVVHLLILMSAIPRPQRQTCSRIRIRQEDWQQCRDGGFHLDLSVQQHGKGNRPRVNIYSDGAGETRTTVECLRLVNRQGCIRLFSTNPIGGTIEIWPNNRSV